jgi:hypothetical protein
MSRAGEPIKNKQQSPVYIPFTFHPGGGYLCDRGVIVFFLSPARGKSKSVMSAANFRLAA